MRCSDIPGDARAFSVTWTVLRCGASIGANPASVKIESTPCQCLYKSSLADNSFLSHFSTHDVLDSYLVY